jgi:hypothetical protein
MRWHIRDSCRFESSNSAAEWWSLAEKSRFSSALSAMRSALRVRRPSSHLVAPLAAPPGRLGGNPPLQQLCD